MVAYKRPSDKSGVPVYQPANNPSAAVYQQLQMQMQQPFVPVSCKFYNNLFSLKILFACMWIMILVRFICSQAAKTNVFEL
jgi:hypothetical protein